MSKRLKIPRSSLTQDTETMPDTHGELMVKFEIKSSSPPMPKRRLRQPTAESMGNNIAGTAAKTDLCDAEGASQRSGSEISVETFDPTMQDNPHPNQGISPFKRIKMAIPDDPSHSAQTIESAPASDQLSLLDPICASFGDYSLETRNHIHDMSDSSLTPLENLVNLGSESDKPEVQRMRKPSATKLKPIIPFVPQLVNPFKKPLSLYQEIHDTELQRDVMLIREST